MPFSPTRREPRLRLALRLTRLYASVPAPPDPTAAAAGGILSRLDRLQRLARLRLICLERQWPTALRSIGQRQASELRELQYQLATTARPEAAVRAVPGVASVYRDLLALDEEFGDLSIDDGLSALSVVTDPITLDQVDLGRFRIVLDLSRLARGRIDCDAVTAEALDPNPAASNDEIVHPHVQGGHVCFGEGGPLLRAALTEGRVYDALVVCRQVLLTYNEASPYVRLDRWSGRACDECDELTAEDELCGCQWCGSSICSGCERLCADCDTTHCRRCLQEHDRDLLCADCLAEREAEAAMEDEEDEFDRDPLPPQETDHDPVPQAAPAAF